MTLFRNIFPILLFSASGTLSAQYIQVDDTYTAQQLVENVLIDSPCANVSNFSVSGDTFNGSQQSYGYFSAPAGVFQFSDGIVLSTSSAYRTEGPNSDLIDEGSVNWQGDSDLEQALGIGSTFNATILEFDFTPLTSQISFEYIFASEEYQGTAPCRYSDGFAFLLKVANSPDPYQNLAVLPNTNIPVLVTSVHPQIDGNNGCQAENEEYFGGFNPTEHPINFNGQTVVMTAKSTVIPGTTYHIKLVIADEENIRYDSAIFLGGGSFNVGTDIGPDQLFATNNPICYGENHVLDATEPGSNTYQWFVDGNLIPGETNPIYTVSAAGTYGVEINLGGTGCVATGEAIIEYSALPILNDPTTLVQCDDDNDGISTFDLTRINSVIAMGNAQLSNITYYESLSDAQSQINPVLNPSAFVNSAISQLIARVTNEYGCVAYATVNLEIANNAISSQSPITVCDPDANQDGITTFDLGQQVTPQILTGLPAGLVTEYYSSEIDAVSQTNPVANNFSNTIPNQQILYVRIVNGPDCYGIVPIALVINTFNPANFDDETVYICEGSNLTLQVSNGFAGYLWSNGETDNSIVINTSGNYSVTVSDANGCTKTKIFNAVMSGIATITSVIINDFSGNQNSVLINYTGAGNYEFSLDGFYFQDSPLFTGIAPGEYTVYINDLNGCGISPPYSIFVMDYPRFFTPNGDGIHDIWEIKNLNSQPAATVNIFNRYGKFLYSFKGNGMGWDGKLNSADLPSSDYWFVITLENGTTVKSHFSLKR